MEEVQQQRVVGLSSKVLLKDSVDAGLQDDVVVARHQANLQGFRFYDFARAALRCKGTIKVSPAP